jgi:predicted ester cyclase
MIETFMDALWNKKQYDAIPQYCDENIVIHGTLGAFHGHAAFHHIASTWLTAFPDMYVSLVQTLCDGDMIVSRWNSTATHQGEFLSYPPTKRSIHYEGVTIYRIKNSRILEYRAYIDTHNLRSQLAGVLDPADSLQDSLSMSKSTEP